MRKLILNHPSALVHPDLSPMLQVRALKEPKTIVTIADQVDQNHLFAINDPSTLMNSILRYPENRTFAADLIHYLAQDDERNDRDRLFVITNDFRQQGSIDDNRSLTDDLKTQLRTLADNLADAQHDDLPP